MEPLPNELLDCVIEKLYSDTPSLLSCALVGKAWVRSSQRGIFREIVLRLPSTLYVNELEALSMRRDAYLNTTKKLVASFDSAPHLASYVQFLELRQIRNEDGVQEALHAATVNVIQRLSNLSCLKLREIEWAIVSPALKTALTELFRIASLTDVTFLYLFITSFAEATSLLNQLPKQLRNLYLVVLCRGDLQITEETEEVDLLPRSIQLEKLTIYSFVCGFMDWFRKDSCPFEVQNLNSLYIGDYNGWDVNRHLHYVGRNLTELEIAFSPETTAYSDCLTHTPNLRVLYLRGIIQTDSSSPVPMIRTIFEPLLNPDGIKLPLEHLTLGLVIDLISPLEAKHWEQWVEVDELLMKPEFALLEEVDVTLSKQAGGSELSGVDVLLAGKLQTLAEEGKLTVHSEIKSGLDN